MDSSSVQNDNGPGPVSEVDFAPVRLEDQRQQSPSTTEDSNNARNNRRTSNDNSSLNLSGTESELGVMSLAQKLGYSFGHVLNDLCACMWFTYLLLFLHKVVQFNNLYAGIVLFTGQIADGIGTTFVGYFSDKGDDFFPCNRYGKRKSWHLIGTIAVLFSFPFIFLRCIGCENSDQWAQLFYYVGFVIIFQFGWAAVQISHLSMIPELSPCQNERTGLTAWRYGMTVASNIAIYLITWIFLGYGSDTNMIGPQDASAFRNIMLVCLSVGAVNSLLFHILTPTISNDENRLNGNPSTIAQESSAAETGTAYNAIGAVLERRRMQIVDWFFEPQFYQVAGVYMSTRLFVNLSQAYIPLYLQITLELEAAYVAIIPLVMFSSGLVTSTLMKKVNEIVGRKGSYILGCFIGMAGCIWIKLGCAMDSDFTGWQIYGIAALIGAGGSTMLIASLSLTADLMGCSTETGAFVYGAMSLTDKFCNGFAVIIIQNYIPGNTDTCPDCRAYFRDILAFVCGAAALFGALCMVSLIPFKLGERFSAWKARRGCLSVNPYNDLDRPDNSEESTAQQQQQQNERTPLLS